MRRPQEFGRRPESGFAQGLRSNRLSGTIMNKIVRSRSATPYSIERSKLHVLTCIVATTLLAVFGGNTPSLLRRDVGTKVRMRYINPCRRVNCGPPRPSSNRPMRLRTNAIPGSMATLERRWCGITIRTNPRRTLNFIVGQRTFVDYEMAQLSDPDGSLLLCALDHRIKNELTSPLANSEPVDTCRRRRSTPARFFHGTTS